MFGEISTGAADDLDRATDIARNMVTRFGMAEKLGQMTYEESRQGFLGQPVPGMTQRTYSEETAREIDCAVRELTDSARERALEILSTHRDKLERGAALLLEKETLHEEELAQLAPSLERKQPKTVAQT